MGLKSWLFGGGTKPQDTQYQDRDQMQALIRGGMGDPGAAYWSQDVTHQAAPQLQMGSDPFRAAQLQQMGQLQRIAGGQQQGAGELAVQRQYGNALAAQQAQARMARGGNAALAYRNAANQSAALGSSAAGLGQQAAMQDQTNANGLLASLGAQGRSGDINVANANAGYQQGTQQLNTQNYLALLGQLGNMNANQLAAKQQANATAAQDKGAIGGLLSTGGQILGSYLARK